MEHIAPYLTQSNALILYAALSLLANLVAAVTPETSLANKAAHKLLALGVDLHKLLGVTPAKAGPGPSSGALMAIVLAGGLLSAAPARAQAQVTFKGCGPSIPLTVLSVGGSLALAPGAGIQCGLDYGKLNLDLALFGNAFEAITQGHTASGSELSTAIYACYAPIGLCAGPSVVLAGSNGGVFGGFTWKNSVRLALGGNFDLANLLHAATAPSTAPSAPLNTTLQ